jgi:hypothetical protein
LQQGVGGRPRLRLRRRGPMAEGEEADVFHGGVERYRARIDWRRTLIEWIPKMS